MRKQPDITPPETLTSRQLAISKQTREYRLITPLYGGGVAPNEADPVTVVRATEIRGHLRFWWRATQGGQAGGSLEKLKTLEDAIWGKAYTKEKEEKAGDSGSEQQQKDKSFLPSVQVEVIVRDSERGEAKRAYDIEETGNKRKPKAVGVPDYAVFPLRPLNDDLREKDKKQLEDEMKKLQHGVSFTLKITFPQIYKEDIEASLWAWETFGGIGARTRRGFGALQLLKVDGKENTELSPSNRPDDVRRWLVKQLQRFVVRGSWPEHVPHLEWTLHFQITNPEARVFSSWNGLIRRYAAFRQSRAKGNTGRSNWPEAETIRNITGRRYYRDLHHPQKFPRAAFGLPIIFHFKDDQKGDPKDTTLQGAEKDYERLASPLILRPLVCKGGSAVGLAAILKGIYIPPLVLKEVGESVEAQLSEQDLTMLPNLNLDHQTNILQAFMDSLGG
jgi:CRISPR-associated protein Cmr1